MEEKRKIDLYLSSEMAIQSVAILLYGKLTDREISVLVSMIKMFDGFPDFIVTNSVREDIAIKAGCSSSQVANVLSVFCKKTILINDRRGYYRFDDMLKNSFDGIDLKQSCLLTFKMNNDE